MTTLIICAAIFYSVVALLVYGAADEDGWGDESECATLAMLWPVVAVALIPWSIIQLGRWITR